MSPLIAGASSEAKFNKAENDRLSAFHNILDNNLTSFIDDKEQMEVLEKQIAAYPGLKEKMIELLNQSIKDHQFELAHCKGNCNNEQGNLSKELLAERSAIFDKTSKIYWSIPELLMTQGKNEDEKKELEGKGVGFALIASWAAYDILGSELKVADEDDKKNVKAFLELVKDKIVIK